MPVLGAFLVPHPPIILPEIGRGEEKKIQKTIDAYREAARRAAALRPETVVITSPHATAYSDYFHISPGSAARGDFARFGAPSVALSARYDAALAAEISEIAAAQGLPAGTQGERDAALDHGTLIPLRFLQEAFSGFPIVRIGLSGLSPVEHYRLGKCIAQAAEALGRRVVFVASGDLSHRLKEDGPYGFMPQGPEFDRKVTKAMAEGDFLGLLSFPSALCERAGECGLRSFQIMAGALDGLAVRPELLSYEGPFGVGYGVAAFAVEGADDARRFDLLLEAGERARLEAARAGEDVCVKLARLSLETYVKTGRYAKLPPDLPRELLERRAGAFVSLKKYGRLRGCIGTIGPQTPSLPEEILENAVSAGTRDPRFPRVTREELPELSYSVDVLGEPEKIESAAGLDVKRYGVIVRSGSRCGLLLPDLPGVDTPEEQLAVAMRKGGIRQGEPVTLERFEAVRHT